MLELVGVDFLGFVLRFIYAIGKLVFELELEVNHYSYA